MRQVIKVFSLIVFVFLSSIWLPPPPVSAATAPIKILPLGDSITRGGYRCRLQKKLKDAGFADFDFIGSQNSDWTQSCSSTYQPYDKDHEGYGSYNTLMILGGYNSNYPNILSYPGIGTSLTNLRNKGHVPGIVLLMLGTNDIGQVGSRSSTYTHDNLTGIIGRLRSANPNVIILLANTIPNFYKYDTFSNNAERVSWINEDIAQVANLTSAASPIYLIDMNTGFGRELISSDNVHPNTAGYEEIATRFFNILKNVVTLDPNNTCPINGNYCIPTREDCDPGDTPNQGGSCANGKVCCLRNSSPPGSVKPPGEALILPPSSSDFSPLKYPCDTTIPNPLNLVQEFHPLRPYPGSPCDPLIPRKNPEAKDDQAKLYLSFACGKSLNPQGTYKFKQWFTRAEFNLLPIFPSDPATAVPGTLYRCDAVTTDRICVTKRSKFDVAIDLSASTLPFLGNTQNAMDNGTKVNSYLSWYLNGAVQHSDQKNLDPNDPEDIQNLIDYSGPVKKLLPQDLNNAIKQALKDGPIKNQYHDYIVSEPIRLSWAWNSLFPNIPYSSLEDTTGEITVSLVTQAICPDDTYSSGTANGLTCSQPEGVWQPNPQNPADPQSMRLIMKPANESDTRLYFPHARNLTALSDILASVHRPFGPLDPITVVSQEIPADQHQGRDGTTVETDYEYPLKPLTQTRNTEIGSVVTREAPPPLFRGEAGSGYDQQCILSDAITNPGDTLMGKSTKATLTYTQRFDYPMQLIPTPPPGCVADGGVCAPYPAGTPKSPCCDQSSGADCTRQGAGAPEGWKFSYRCTGGISREEIELTTQGRVAVYTKTPFADRLYSTLVTSRDSVLHRFIPGPSPTPTVLPGQPIPEYRACNAEYLKGENCPAQTVPAKTGASYSATAGSLVGEPSSVTVPANPGVTAGGENPGSAEIYFPRLGSLHDYFLGAGRENLNLQRLLRPKDLNSLGDTVYIPPDLTDSPLDPNCDGKSGTIPTATDIKYSSDGRFAFPMAPMNDVWYSCSHWDKSKATDIGKKGDLAKMPPAQNRLPILAYTAGTIKGVLLGDDIAGHRIELDGDDGRRYYYSHNCKIFVTPNQRVTAGQVIATSDNTGSARNSVEHLHFEIHDQDPATLTQYCPAADFINKFALDNCDREPICSM